jgi:hypothetical protein
MMLSSDLVAAVAADRRSEYERTAARSRLARLARPGRRQRKEAAAPVATASVRPATAGPSGDLAAARFGRISGRAAARAARCTKPADGHLPSSAA